jgi:phosphoribosylanthranilate isomerase
MWVKVCGIRDRETARQIAELDVDAIGLNFYSRSCRFVDAAAAKQISEAVSSKIKRVGVFVNHTITEIDRLVSYCQLDIVQLHGDESASFFVELQHRIPETRLMKAWRMNEQGIDGLRAFLEECSSRKLNLAGCLIDSHVPGIFGGSGKTLDWEQLRNQYDHDNWPRLILAGGLNPSNIAVAIATARPWGVDVASGVESAPGEKDLHLVRNFVLNAKATDA